MAISVTEQAIPFFLYHNSNKLIYINEKVVKKLAYMEKKQYLCSVIKKTNNN